MKAEISILEETNSQGAPEYSLVATTDDALWIHSHPFKTEEKAIQAVDVVASRIGTNGKRIHEIDLTKLDARYWRKFEHVDFSGFEGW